MPRRQPGGPRSPRRATPAPQPRSWRRSKLLGPLLLIVLPLLGAVAGGRDLGLVFAVAAVAAGLGAAAVCSPGGLWWIVPCTPTALLAVAFGWVGVDTLAGAKTTVAAATGVFQGIAGAFPGIAAGTAAALVVACARAARGAADRRGTRG